MRFGHRLMFFGPRRVRTLSLAQLLLVLLSGAVTSPGYDWETGPGYRRARLEPARASKDGFTLLEPGQTGVTFTNVLAENRALASLILPSGSGVAAGDVDGDGWCDLYFCGLKTGNRLYRNLGNFKFEDITERAGVGCTNLDATGAALVDLNGDGSLDLIVNSLGGGTHVFFNDGHGRFTESKQILNPGRGGMSLGIGDYDGDGMLDVYVANYRANSIADRPGIRFNVRMVEGRMVVGSIDNQPLTNSEWTNRFIFQLKDDGQGSVKFSHEELGEPDALYRNLGGGRFEPVPFTGGAFLDEEGKPLTQPPLDWGLSVMFRDLNGDGKPDLYLCNDFTTPDRIWINDGHGHFRALPRQAMRHTPLSAMAVDVADINRDGFDDLFVGDMLSREHRRRLVQRTNLRPEVLPLGGLDNRPQYSRNLLQLNRGDGTYAEIAYYAGVEASEWSWTPIFLDVDLDGYEDLLVANGFVRDNMNLDAMDAAGRVLTGQRGSMSALTESRRLFPTLPTANLAFRNLGGLQFEEVGRQWGFDTKVISQGMCLADLDNDGDLDVIANNFNSVAGIYRNDTAKPRVAATLKGLPPNTHGIGGRIRVYGGPVPFQSQEIISGGRYLSCDQAMRVFAAGALTNGLRIEVDWPGGRRSVVNPAAPNCVYELDEASAGPAPAPVVARPTPWFEDVSGLLTHIHQEEPFDDFARQPTLPKRLSQLGPGVCWCDLRGNGRADLVIGSGKGGVLSVFLNDGRGGWQPARETFLNQPLTRDQTAVVALPRGSNGCVLLAGSANYEDGQPSGAAVVAYDLAANRIREVAPGTEASVGPLALGDLEGDGRLALFVGGRTRAAMYPAPVNSRLFVSQAGAFVPDAANNKVLENVGMVSGATWSDLDGDGFPELILACEWGPIRIFRNDHGRLSPWNPRVTVPAGSIPQMRAGQPVLLEDLQGWWNGVAVGDFDGDGRLDIIASNWGENTKYQGHRAAPLRLYYADFNEEGVLGLIEAYFEPGMGKYVPENRLDLVSRGMPFLRARFPTFQAFADATVDEALGDRQAQARFLEANWLETTLFLNRGDHFEARALPLEAQLAPVFAVVVADLDGDGYEDIFLGQNFFAVEPETSRYDAGRGLLLKGDGHGGWRALPGPESGVMVYGEQRGAAAADFDGDGRVDLVVTQNAAPTKLFRNRGARPGLRVRLRGPPGNPWGFGAQLRQKRGDQYGPVREVHGGGGYWSQDSPVQVVAGVEPPAQLWIRWPGGKSFVVDVPAGAAEVQVGIDGSISRVR